MSSDLQSIVRQATKANKVIQLDEIQDLWGGYGKIFRFGLEGACMPTVVVKHVQFPTAANHPRGWNTSLSHQRKVRSYEIELTWYKQWSQRCNDSCRVPICFGADQQGDEVYLVLEDMDAAGFAGRRNEVSQTEIVACLSWLANFHAVFMQASPTKLWEVGCYWHLGTRPDELAALEDEQLRRVAPLIDQKLQSSPYQTIVHGDAKLANFCFAEDGQSVAAVDFQYVGGGCGMKDVTYFLGSCLHEDELQQQVPKYLDIYFEFLYDALALQEKKLNFADLEQNWRGLYPYAWADFHRFLKGWSPGHWKLNSYSERLTNAVVVMIGMAER